MGHILIAYTTGEGQTARVAEYLDEFVTRAGHRVDRVDLAEREPSLEPYTLVVLAGSIHMGRVQPRLVRYVRDHREQLEGRCAFFLVCLTAMNQSDEAKHQIEEYLAGFSRDTGVFPEPVAVFAGRLAYTRYGVLKRWLMKKVASQLGGDTDTSRDHEYTSWDAVAAFGDRLVQAVREAEGGAMNLASLETGRFSARPTGS